MTYIDGLLGALTRLKKARFEASAQTPSGERVLNDEMKHNKQKWSDKE